MSSEKQQIKIGLSAHNPCNYLENRIERVAVALGESLHTTQGYELLLANGFRRSGDIIYTPHCEMCNACQSVRLSIADFHPSRSQKRILNKANHLRWEMKKQMDDNWFEIYSQYINQRHADGSMYPPKEEDFFKFSGCSWLDTEYLHIYEEEKLLAIAVTDVMQYCASAFYTFYDPDYPVSLGTLGVLYQAEFCQIQQKQWLYLGYQIDECPAMNYKVRFQRHQRLVNQRWQG